MDKEGIRELVKSTIEVLETKDTSVYESNIHRDFSIEQKSYYGENWNIELLKSIDKKKFIEYMDSVLQWQDYNINYYDIVVEDSQAMCFVNTDLFLRARYHPIIEIDGKDYGPVKYNFAYHVKIKENQIITSNIIQDTDTFRIGVGELLVNEQDHVKVKKYLERLIEGRYIS